MTVPEVFKGQVILVTTNPNNPTWMPAVVERCSPETGQCVATAIINGGTRLFEGCKHVEDPWWQNKGSVELALEEGIGMWKHSEFTEQVYSALCRCEKQQAKSTENRPTATAK